MQEGGNTPIMHRSPKKRAALLTSAALTLVLAGCYRYMPVRLEDVPVGKDVRAHLSSAAESRLAELVPISGRVVEGVVLQTSSSVFVLHVPVITSMQRGDMFLRQRIDLSPEEIAGLELKELDHARTGMLVGAVGIGVLALVIKVLLGQTHQSSGPPVVDGSESVVPISRW